MKKIFFCMATVLILAGSIMPIPVLASPGMDAYERGDYAMALRIWKAKAKSGDSHAQYNIGWLYIEGRVVQKNDAKAVKWFAKAAKQGMAKAQSNLGVMYAHGRGIKKDYIRAYMWSKLAAEQGDSVAQDSVSKLLRVMKPSQISRAEQLVRNWKPK